MKTLDVSQRAALGSRYAWGLFHLCKRSERVVEIAEQLRELGDLIQQSDELENVLFNPVFSPRLRLSIIARLMPEADEWFLRLLNILFKRGRIDYLPDIIAKFDKIAESERGLDTVTAVLATDVDAQNRGRIAMRIGEWLRIEAQVRFEVDPSIMGGMKIQMGDWIYDGSVTGQLERARRIFLSEI